MFHLPEIVHVELTNINGYLSNERLEGFLLEQHGQHLISDFLTVPYENGLAIPAPANNLLVLFALSDPPLTSSSRYTLRMNSAMLSLTKLSSNSTYNSAIKSIIHLMVYYMS